MRRARMAVALVLGCLLGASGPGRAEPEAAPDSAAAPETIAGASGDDSLGPSAPVEPPADAVEGEDVALEGGDSLATGEVELGLGLEETASGRLERRRRVRFDEPDLSGAVREGSGDPLSGGAIESRGAGHALQAGRLAPQWGRGLVLGASSDPWERTAVEPDRPGGRSRSGEGVRLASGRERGVEIVAGRFARRDLAGLRARDRDVALGVLMGRDRALQSSLGFRRGEGRVEAALDRGGAWRMEGRLARPLGPWTAAAAVRGGREAFRPLADPEHAGPSRGLTLALAGASPLGEARALAATWRYRPGVAGARVAFEVRRRLGDRQKLAWGLEEQHGVRRESAIASGSLRQGAWIEWSGAADPFDLTVRHETWGAEAGLRDVVRAITTARVEVAAPLGVRLALTHAAFRTRRGESLYLAESESDRLVLRALAGEGAHSRLELRVPAGRGQVRGTVRVTALAGRRAEARWSLEWIRRSRRPAPHP